jgi:hypothetical protein
VSETPKLTASSLFITSHDDANGRSRPLAARTEQPEPSVSFEKGPIRR